MGKLEGISPVLDAVVRESTVWLSRIQKLIRPHNVTTAMNVVTRAEELHHSFYGTGLDALKNHKMYNRYDSPPRYWSEEDYVRAIQLRSNRPPTAGLPCNQGL